MTNSSRAIVTEELVNGWYLKRTSLVSGSLPLFISLCEREVVLGRFICSSPHISWEHVLFQKTENNNISIKDLKSVNGTFINGKKIKSGDPYAIQVGDRIALGKKIIKKHTDFEFQLCFTQQPLKLMVTKKCAALKSSENRRHTGVESRESVENVDVPENPPFPKSCSENRQPNGTTGIVATTLNRSSTSDNVTRTCTTQGSVKRSGSQLEEISPQARKKLSSEEHLFNSPVENKRAPACSPPPESDLTHDNPHNADDRFGKEVVQQKRIENHSGIDHRTKEKPQKEDYRFGKEVVQEKPVQQNLLESHIGHQTIENPQKEDHQIGKEDVQQIESSIDHRTLENEIVTSRMCSRLEIDVTLDNPEKADTGFGNEAIKNPVEKQTWHQTRENNLLGIKNCYVNLAGSDELVKSYMQKKNRRRKKRKDLKKLSSFCSSESAEESASSFVKQNAGGVSVKGHRKRVWFSESEEDVFFLKHEDGQPDVKQRHSKYVGKESFVDNIPGTCSIITKRKHACITIIDSDDELGKSFMQKSLSWRKKGTDSNHAIQSFSSSESDKESAFFGNQKREDVYVKRRRKCVLGSDSEEDVLNVKERDAQSCVKHRHNYGGNKSFKENLAGHGAAKRRRLTIIDSDEESAEMPPSISPQSGDEKHLLTIAGRQNNSEDGTVQSHCDSVKTFLSSSSCSEEKPTSICSDSLKKGGDTESSISRVVQNIKKEPVDDIDKLRGQRDLHDDSNNGFVYSQVDEVIIISSDDDDDHAVIFASKPLKSDGCVSIKLEPLDSDYELGQGDQNSTSDSVCKAERLEISGPEDEHKTSHRIEDHEGNNCSDFPGLSQSFQDDKINRLPEENTSLASPSEEKLKQLIHRDKMRKVSTTSFTEALPNVERRRRRNGWMEEAARVEVKEVIGKKSDKRIAEKGWQTKKVINSKRTPKKLHDIRKIIQEQQGHRIRMPGGGSAIRSKPTGDKSRSTRTLKTVTKQQINQTRPKVKSKVVIPIANLPVSVPKRAPKLTTEQRFPSRQEVLIESIKLKTGSSEISKKSGLSEAKISQTPKQVGPQNFKVPLDMDRISERSSVENDHKRLAETRQLLNNNSSLKSTNTPGTGTSNINISKPEVNVSASSQISEIPNILTEKSAAESPNLQDPRLLKVNTYCKSSLEPNVTPSDSLHSLNVLNKILNWKTVWLKEQQRCNTEIPPPVVDRHLLRETALSYTSFDEYCNTYYPLLMLEIWASVYNDWNAKTKPYVKMCINHYVMKDDLWELTCQTVVPSDSDKIQLVGHLVIIPLRIIGTNQARPVFGYVSDYKSESLENVSVPTLIHNFVESTKNGKLATYVIKVVSRSLTLDLNQLVKIEPTSNIKPQLRQMEAIFALHNSVLVRDILCARPDFFVDKHKPDMKLVSLGKYNHSQKEAILGAAYAIAQPYAIPQMKLFQGPPGTGKTSTIIGLIQQILHPSSGGNQKLLVVSSSNGSVDEIARRLIQIRPRLRKAHPSWKFRLVRVGLSSEISTDVKCIWIDELAWKNLMSKTDTDSSLKQKIKREDEVIANLQQQLGNTSPTDVARRLRLETEKKSHNQRLNFYRNKLGKVEQKPVSHQSSAFKKQVQDVLENADVILSTINSSRQSILEQTFGKKESSVKFTCCIVDEATNCSEPELLTPLQYGISKLILVGDPTQLGVRVASQKASSLKFDMSFFERVFKFFQRTCEKSPVLMLTEQHRMHSEIARFPSQHFYAEKLCTPQSLDREYSSFPLKPYVCIDIPEGKENSSNNGTNIRNPYETILVVKLVENLLHVIPTTSSVGVITFNKGQRGEFSTLLNSQLHTRVEIESLNGFQGREKDVIILACVRTENSTGFLSNIHRMNVAITRARQCFIVCGNLKLLCHHQHWKELIDDACRRNVIVNMTAADSVSSVINKLRNNACQ